MDPERIQFVADIITPKHDPENIYALSSRFHRYFLKNLDQNDINVRIMRVRDNTKHARPSDGHPGTPQPTLITPEFPKTPAPYTSTVSLGPGGAGSTSYSHFTTPFHSTKTSFKFNHNLPVTKSPYPFETVGFVNKQIRNPFLFLNSGERPSKHHPHHNDIHRSFYVQPATESPPPVSHSYSPSSSYFYNNLGR